MRDLYGVMNSRSFKPLWQAFSHQKHSIRIDVEAGYKINVKEAET